jgi:hypothetical protein
MMWPPSGHIALAFMGLATGFAASHYPEGTAPAYAAIFGTFVLYPLMAGIWWLLHRSGGSP